MFPGAFIVDLLCYCIYVPSTRPIIGGKFTFLGQSTVWPTIHLSTQHRKYQTQIARFVWPTWGPPGSWRPQVGPTLAPWILLSGKVNITCHSGSDPWWVTRDWPVHGTSNSEKTPMCFQFHGQGNPGTFQPHSLPITTDQVSHITATKCQP